MEVQVLRRMKAKIRGEAEGKRKKKMEERGPTKGRQREWLSEAAGIMAA